MTTESDFQQPIIDCESLAQGLGRFKKAMAINFQERDAKQGDRSVTQIGDRKLSESACQQTIIEAARAHGFLVYHSFASRHSEPGFLDLVMVSQEPMPPRLIFAELKVGKGKLTQGRISPRTGRWLPGQKEWLDAFGRCATAPPVEVYLWRLPQDLDAALEILAIK